ncbi:MAG: tRNA (adenosine(37)-N6)-threonylcarbamoyltransferase complex dimerization subunit type 1 TsaB [Spirochaetales bacterium]|nr:tRNA (adenosine(37)-N6)-threonylcarbamoyltransferase complex dimerization subunit type 1 TsaB [Spirochaetales bacterium]
MNILAFDTSTEIFSVSLKIDKNNYAFSCSRGYKHSETLVTEIDSILKKGSSSVKDLDLIVCPRGPGSFTGLRIGMATAKGLSLGSGIPMVTVPTLDMMAFGLEFYDGIVVPIIDARKNRFYTAFYYQGRKITDNLDLTFEEISNKLNEYDNVLFAGPDREMFTDNYKDSSFYKVESFSSKIWSTNLIELGQLQFAAGGSSHETEGPLYLRKSEAELGKKLKP